MVRAHAQCAYCAHAGHMELLFEYEGSRCRLNPSLSEAVVECVLEELRKFDDKAFILLGSGAGKEDVTKPLTCSEYLLQKWSQKWGAYVDVAQLKEVEDGDKTDGDSKAYWSQFCEFADMMYRKVGNLVFGGAWTQHV